MSFAKGLIIGTVRAVRQAGTVGLFIVGLLVGSAIIAQSPGLVSSLPNDPARLRADAGELSSEVLTGASKLMSDPWSRVMGKPGFDNVTDIAMAGENSLVFAGISLGTGISDESGALLLRTGPTGFVHSQTSIDDPRLGNVTRAVLSDNGGARLVHWVGANPGFAAVSPDGTVQWSRTFDVQSDTVWAEIEVASHGETLVALTEGQNAQTTKIMRLDEDGRVLWRHVLEAGGPLEHITLADSGDGGVLLATERVTGAERHEIAMARIDRRGREVWRRTLYSDYGVALAHTELSTRGGVVLIGGEPSALFRFDATGQLNWVREVPALDPAGRHLVTESPDGSWHVLAEPQSATQSRRHWLARFSSDGRLVWAHTRTNRTGASLEAAIVTHSGAMLAGGSVQSSATGDTDMLFMAIGEGGVFPRGFDGPGRPVIETPQSKVILADSQMDQPLLPASAIVETSLALEAEMRPVAAQEEVMTIAAPLEPLDTFASAGATPLYDVARPRQARPEDLPIAPEPQPDTAIGEAAIAVAAAEVVTSDAKPPATELQMLAFTPPTPGLKPQRISVAPEAAPSEPQSVALIESVSSAVSEQPSEVVSYACTFTCRADAADVVPYPVSRIIDDASELNASLFALDIMAMDHSVCMATGGRIYDLPRLPPECERLN